jgi:hypothetical protein
MGKTYKLSDYLEAISKKNNKEEDEFFVIQSRIHKNLSKDIIDLLNSLESDGIPAPKDFVFMTYFAMFWNRMMSMYKDDQEKQDVINLFNSIMSDKDERIKHESIN